mmetsp:Transcript_104209/g.179601  ORF Transcript_104209/g.179601 Transcript_104209/m.179601 type:complete len:100 (+) Transcript_104209:25-324(+)
MHYARAWHAWTCHCHKVHNCHLNKVKVVSEHLGAGGPQIRRRSRSTHCLGNEKMQRTCKYQEEALVCPSTGPEETVLGARSVVVTVHSSGPFKSAQHIC